MTDSITQIIKYAGLVLLESDCVAAMENLPAECVDSIVTDPPYGLEFMGKEWDKLSDESWHYRWAYQALRLLKPGGHMLVFGGTRTYHRLACAVEDAGFEIRDSIHWVYGSGFPKSLDVSKAIDKAAGVEREVVGTHTGRRATPIHDLRGGGYTAERPNDLDASAVTAPTTDAAKQWDGWGTALKPAHEPILLARKPLGEKTVAANVLEYGTGGLNIDGGRIEAKNPISTLHGTGTGRAMLGNVQENWPDTYKTGDGGLHNTQNLGRWPSNLILQHDGNCIDSQCIPECPIAELDEQSGVLQTHGTGSGHVSDSGGASRFFYQAKSSKSERNNGCSHLYWQRTKSGHTPIPQAEYDALDPKQRAQGNIHPTVKPVELMRYLIRLITPPGGIVLEPFLGSGTTALAAHLEGFGCLAMEQDPTSVLISRARWEAR